MKKIYVFFALIAAVLSAHSQCTIDAAAQPRPGISPSAADLPCIITSAPYDKTLQVQCPGYFDTVVNLIITTYPVTVTIDSIELDSVINLPAGITWTKNPDRLNGGQNGCLTFSGTTTASTGYYHLTWYGTAWVTEPYGLGNKTVTGSLNRYGYVDYYLNVINPGDSCTPYNPNGITNINPELNTELIVSPNPSNGLFTLKLNAGSRVTGQVEIIDVTGRIIYSQDVDLIGLENINIDLSKSAKGIYTLLLKTPNGNATKRISID